MITTTSEVLLVAAEYPDGTAKVVDGDDAIDVSFGDVAVQFRADTLDESVRRFVAITRVKGRRVDRRVVLGAGAVRTALEVARTRAGLPPLSNPAVPSNLSFGGAA